MGEIKNGDCQLSLVEVMLEFVRAAVLEREPLIPESLEIAWDALMDMASEQGLVAWVWDGICKLPENSQPPRHQRINWGLSAQSYWDDYEKKKETLSNLIDICSQNNIRLLLLKGIGLSMLYPKPQSRMSGDIDIYLFEDYQKGNIILSGKRIHEKSKHSTIVINGVTIENHNNFLEPNTTQKRRIIRLIKSSLGQVRLMQEGYYTLCPLSNLVFLTFHTLKHFYEGKQIPIRNIIDFALFIEHNKDRLPPDSCREVLIKQGLLKSFEFLICFSEWILNINIPRYHFVKMPKEHLAVLRKILFDNQYELNSLKDNNYISQYLPKNSRMTAKKAIKILAVRVLSFFREFKSDG